MLVALGLPAAASGAGYLPRGPLHPAGRWIEDATGRVIIVHGLELARKTPPYYAPDPSFTARDARQIENWGFDAVRLGWFWKGLEPERGQMDNAYLAQLVRDGDLLARHHIFTLLEAHQDGFNETLGGAGFPDWATITDGTWGPAEGVPGTGEFDLQAARAFDNLYANTDGVGDAFAHAWSVMAGAFRSNPMMLGYDLFNEPNPGSQWESCANPVGCPGFDLATLEPLENRLAAAVRSADPRTIAFYEPNIDFDSGVPSWLGPVPAASGPSGFAFHDYCLAAALSGQPDHESSATGYPGCSPVDQYVFSNALRAATVMGVPPLFDEFGDTQDVSDIERVIALADQSLTGWVYWGYKDWVDDPGGQGSGALFDDSDDNGTLRQSKLAALSQPYAVATAGTPLAAGFDPTSDTFTYSYRPDRSLSAPTVIFTAPLHYPRGYRVVVSGARVLSAPGARYLVLSVGGSGNKVQVALTPVPGASGSPSAPAPSSWFAAAPAPSAASLPVGQVSGSCNGNADRPAPVASPSAAPNLIAEVQTRGGSGEVTAPDGISVVYGAGDTGWANLGSGSIICRSGATSYSVTFFDAPTAPVSFTGASTHVTNVSLANSRLAFDIPASGRYLANVTTSGGPVEVGLRRQDGTTPPAQVFTSSGVLDLGALAAGAASLDVTALGAQARWTISVLPAPG